MDDSSGGLLNLIELISESVEQCAMVLIHVRVAKMYFLPFLINLYSSGLHISANEKLIKWPQNHWPDKCTAAVTTFQSTLRSQRECSLPRHSHSRVSNTLNS